MFFHNLLPRMRNGAKHLTYQLGHLFELVFCQYCQVVPFVVTHHVLAPPLVDGLVILGESIVQILSQAFMNNGQLACSCQGILSEKKSSIFSNVFIFSVSRFTIIVEK